MQNGQPNYLKLPNNSVKAMCLKLNVKIPCWRFDLEVPSDYQQGPAFDETRTSLHENNN